MERYSELIELPSQGRLYGDKLPGGEIEIYAMGAEEEAILINKSKQESSRALDRLIERCIKTDFPSEELLISDRLYIFLMMRKISYSDTYKYRIKCPHCGFSFMHEISIPGSFMVTLLDEGVKEPFYVDLPRCKKRIGFKLLRASDEKDAQMYIRNQNRSNKSSDADPGYLYRLAKHMISIDDIPEEGKEASITSVGIVDALTFVKTMIGMDSSKFKDAIADNDCGIDLRMDVECNSGSCGEEFKATLEFTAEFFRPESD